jgi:glycosyltransferase involved in cell wall biosynthesis
MSPAIPSAVLHYVGYDADRGGILAVIRALASERAFPCVLGVNSGFAPRPGNTLELQRFSPLAGETINAAAIWRTRRVAREAREWLREDARRMFHGHSRAGLLVATWLRRWGERRAVATVHCYGRQRWFYRWAAERLGNGHLYWLSPAMRRFYALRETTDPWQHCLPGCVAQSPVEAPTRRSAPEVVQLGGGGTLTPWKRWHLVIEALAAMPPERRRRFVFRHIGGVDGSAASLAYRERLVRQTEACGLADTIQWRGEAPDSAALLAATDCLLVTSKAEPFSVAMLEALFAGVPVLAAAEGGALDVVSPGANGWLFSGEEADLGRALTGLLNDDAWTRLKMEGTMLSRFTAETMARRHLEVYRSVLHRGTA